MLKNSLIRVLQQQGKDLTLRHFSSSGCRPFLFSNDATKSTGHSTLLANKNEVYEVRVEDISPRQWEEYLSRKADYMSLLNTKSESHCELVAGWKFIYGDVNFRAMYLIRYPEGWTDIDKTRLLLKNNEEFMACERAGWQLMNRQTSEFLKSFSYWPIPNKRSGNNIYDVRSYRVKPGSMYDWGNYWSKGIQCRQGVRPDIPYAGFFSQLGRLHTIYHIWCYSDLADRKSCRENTWHNQGWNEVVANTVPLIRSMSTRILEPLPFSPTQ